MFRIDVKAVDDRIADHVVGGRFYAFRDQ